MTHQDRKAIVKNFLGFSDELVRNQLATALRRQEKGNDSAMNRFIIEAATVELEARGL